MQAISPGRAAAVKTNPSLQKMSVPSIPSRFLSPVIDASAQPDPDGSNICKMSRLVDDPSKVGPGSYEVSDDPIRKSPKATISWMHSQSQRNGYFATRNTDESVGPGSYRS